MVVEFMDAYSLSQEDFDTIVDLSKFHVKSKYSKLFLLDYLIYIFYL